VDIMDARKMAEDWTLLWNGDFDLAEKLLAPDFRIHFGRLSDAEAGDGVAGPAGMVGYIRAVHARNPDVRFTMDPPVVADTDQFALRWASTRADRDVSGTDVARLADGKIAEVWSVVGERRI
jgi:predicted SnoaL-like aldol condensation-catalyzing enzyme